MKKACPQCGNFRDELIKIDSQHVRCPDCIAKSGKNFIEQSLETFALLREAAIEEGKNPDLCDIAYDNAVDRLTKRYS